MVDGWFNICMEELSWQNPQRASSLRNRLICYGVISLQCTGTPIFIVPPPAKSHFNLHLHRTYTDMGYSAFTLTQALKPKNKHSIYYIIFMSFLAAIFFCASKSVSLCPNLFALLYVFHSEQLFHPPQLPAVFSYCTEAVNGLTCPCVEY